MRTHRRGILSLAVILLLAANLSAPSLASDWTVQTILRSGNVGWYINLLRTPEGTLYTTCFTSPSGMVAAAFSQGAWTFAPNLTPGYGPAALDAAGRLYVLHNYSSYALKLSHLAAGTWVTEDVPVSGGLLVPSGLQFDSQNNPHIAYIHVDSRALKHIYRVGSTWTGEVVATDDRFQYANRNGAMALDNYDRPHFLWYGMGETLEHARWTPSGYVRTTLARGNGTSMVFDSGNNLHISYVVPVPYGTVYYGRFDGTGWLIRQVDSFCGDPGSVALDRLEEPHLVYNASRDDLRHAAWDGARWWIDRIEGWGDPVSGPECSAQVIDRFNRVHVVFVDDSQYLNYAYRDIGLLIAPLFDVTASSTDGMSFSVIDGAQTISTQWQPATSMYQRGLMEFDLSRLPSGFRVTSATLHVQTKTYVSSPSSYLSVFGYAGDGAPQPADALNVGEARRIGRSVAMVNVSKLDIPLDTAFVNQLHRAATKLGVVLYDSDEGQPIQFHASEAGIYGNVDPPRLRLDYARLADLNNDGNVDAADLLILVASFGTTDGEPLYDPGCDFNNDGAVDVVDLLDMVYSFGI